MDTHEATTSSDAFSVQKTKGLDTNSNSNAVMIGTKSEDMASATHNMFSGNDLHATAAASSLQYMVAAAAAANSSLRVGPWI